LTVPESLQNYELQNKNAVFQESELLTEDYVAKIKRELPSELREHEFTCLYSSTRNGYSFNSLLQFLQNKKYYVMNPTILIIKDDNSHIFGGFMTTIWRKYSVGFYGEEGCFLFTLHPKIQFYHDNGMGIGGTEKQYGLWLDIDFFKGKSYPCDTFNNPCLAHDNEFSSKIIECWGLIPQDKLKMIQEFEQQQKEKTKSVLEDKQNTYILDLLGKNYSSMIPE